MKKILALVSLLLIPTSVFSATSYEIEAAVNDEKFIINGELFEAKTYCLGWDEGERVIFIDGSPMGACSTAVSGLLDMPTIWPSEYAYFLYLFSSQSDL